MKKKYALARIASAGNKVASEAGGLAQDVYTNTLDFMGDLSRSFARINWTGMYKGSRKSFRVAVKRGNKFVNRTVRTFRKSDFYGAVNTYMLLIRKWSKVQFKNFKKLSVVSYRQSRRWINKTYPKVKAMVGGSTTTMQGWASVQFPKIRSFVQKNYPVIQSIQGFVMTQLPVYRAAFAK